MIRLSVGAVVAVLILLILVPCGRISAEEPAHAVMPDSAEVVEADSLIPDTLFVPFEKPEESKREPLDRDVMTAGGVVNVLTPVAGDLFAAGGEVTVDTTVMGDIWAAGAIVSISGSAGGDLRAAGYRVKLAGLVKSNCVTFCNSFVQEPGSEVWGDLAFYCEKARIGGTVVGQLKGNGSTIAINGVVKGGVTVSGSRVMVGSNAVIEGDLVYESANDAAISKDAKIYGGVVHNVPEGEGAAEPAVGGLLRFSTGMKIVWFVGMLIVGLFLSVFAPDIMTYTDEVLRASPFVSLLAGFVLLVCVPVGLVILLVVVVGWPLMMLVSLLYVAGIVFSGIFVGLSVGRVVFLKVERAQKSIFWPMALGVLILVIVSSIPFVGFLIRGFVVMFGLGALWVTQWRLFRERRA